jgi:hypothetical protein
MGKKLRKLQKPKSLDAVGSVLFDIQTMDPEEHEIHAGVKINPPV